MRGLALILASALEPHGFTSGVLGQALDSSGEPRNIDRWEHTLGTCLPPATDPQCAQSWSEAGTLEHKGHTQTYSGPRAC